MQVHLPTPTNVEDETIRKYLTSLVRDIERAFEKVPDTPFGKARIVVTNVSNGYAFDSSAATLRRNKSRTHYSFKRFTDQGGSAIMNRSQLMSLIKKIHNGTPGTGMKDDVPASIGGQQPAALSEGEYVIPADCVAILGDGNSDAGAKVLEQMCQQLRKTKGKHYVKGAQGKSLT